MSRDELLDEAIAKAKEAEDWRLVEWLRMARGGESAARWYARRLRELEAENARLRDLLDYMEPIALYAASERERERMRELGEGA